jgi:hypothetical protein
VACRDYLDHRHRCHLSALFLVDLSLRRCAIAGVSCRCAIFGTQAGELVMPISRARFLQGAIDRLCLLRDIGSREGYKNRMHAHLSSSSNFFSERCFCLRAVSSRCSAISASFSCFSLHGISSIDSMARISRRQRMRNINAPSETREHRLTSRVVSGRFPSRDGRSCRLPTRCHCPGLDPYEWCRAHERVPESEWAA